MLEEIRALERRYALSNYPYADSVHNQKKLKMLGVATEQVTRLKPPPPSPPEPKEMPPVPKKTDWSEHIPLLLGAGLIYLWYQTA